MSDKLPLFAAEFGTYSTTGPSVNLSGTAIDFGDKIPTRTFAAAAADVSLDFDDGDTCQVAVVKSTDKSVWAIYDGVTWNDLATDTLDLSSGTLRSSAGTFSNGDTVNCWAQDPFGRKMPDAEGVSQGTPPQVDASGEWTV